LVCSCCAGVLMCSWCAPGVLLVCWCADVLLVCWCAPGVLVCSWCAGVLMCSWCSWCAPGVLLVCWCLRLITILEWLFWKLVLLKWVILEFVCSTRLSTIGAEDCLHVVRSRIEEDLFLPYHDLSWFFHAIWLTNLCFDLPYSFLDFKLITEI
jgi:hypothetical protein